MTQLAKASQVTFLYNFSVAMEAKQHWILDDEMLGLRLLVTAMKEQVPMG